MYLESLGVSVWITDASGNTLPEYEVMQLEPDDNPDYIKCWVPSIEGKNFEVRFGALKDAQPGLDLSCVPFLDGIEVDGGTLRKNWIASGAIGSLQDHMMNEEDVITNDSYSRGYLNTIRVELEWGRAGDDARPREYRGFKSRGPVREKDVKHGHPGSAELGDSIDVGEPEAGFGFKADPDIKGGIFVFQYAPREWLIARGIIPHSRSKSPALAIQVSQKRPRSATPEVIDVDDIEANNDEAAVISHMAPVFTSPVQKRHKARADAKKEVDGEPVLVEANNKDIKRE